jgi:hypothetical protein
MHAANNNGINILGAIILRFSGKSKSGQTLETRQIVYVTSDSDKLFLSRETCAALGTSGTFPTVGETPQLSTENETNMSSDAAGQTHQPNPQNVPESAHNPPCDRPHHVTPPPKPNQPPFPVTKANRKRLQEWLLDYYSPEDKLENCSNCDKSIKFVVIAFQGKANMMESGPISDLAFFTKI